MREEELPPPHELMPISQTLITPDLALAFDIRNSAAVAAAGNTPVSLLHHHHLYNHQQQQQSNSAPQPNSSEFDSSSAEMGGGCGGVGGVDEPARTLKRPRLVWTPQLHKRFVDAVAHLGIKNAVPKTIMQLMSVDGLTRENVASHLQKYRLYLKRMQGLNNGPGPGGDPATDHLFTSSPVPAHFLHQTGPVGVGGGGGRPNSDHFMPYMPVVAAAVGVANHHPQIQAQYNHHRQMGHFDQNPFLSRQAQAQTLLGPNRNGLVQNSGYVEDMESGTANNGRKVLTLFPTLDD